MTKNNEAAAKAERIAALQRLSDRAKRGEFDQAIAAYEAMKRARNEIFLRAGRRSGGSMPLSSAIEMVREDRDAR